MAGIFTEGNEVSEETRITRIFTNHGWTLMDTDCEQEKAGKAEGLAGGLHFDVPYVDPVPEDKSLEMGRAPRALGHRPIDDLEAVLKRGLVFFEIEGGVEFCHGTGAEDVKDREREQPEPKPAAAARRFGRFRGGGLGLVCKGLGHRREALHAPEFAVPVVEALNGRYVVIQEDEWGVNDLERLDDWERLARFASQCFEDRAWTECVDEDEHGNQPKDAAAGGLLGIRGGGRVVGHVQRISGFIGSVKGRND